MSYGVMTGCWVALILAHGAGCSRPPLTGPPELRLGRDECAECGMLINEDRCSAATLIEIKGRREHRLFDDLGCLFDWERARHDDVRLISHFAHDHGTRAWIVADQATFLATDADRLTTPMASGMVAFAERAAAELAQREYGGELLNFNELRAARQAWFEARRGPNSRPRG